MKYAFNAKRVDMATGGKHIVIINTEDAKHIDVANLDRVRIYANKRQASALINLTERYIEKGFIGFMKEIGDELKIRKKQKIFVEPIEKPASVNLIKKKMEGGKIGRAHV